MESRQGADSYGSVSRTLGRDQLLSPLSRKVLSLYQSGSEACAESVFADRIAAKRPARAYCSLAREIEGVAIDVENIGYDREASIPLMRGGGRMGPTKGCGLL